MVPRGGMGRRSSCHPGGMGIPPSVHQTSRRASSRSEAGIGLFPGLIGKSQKNTSEENDVGSKYLLVPPGGGVISSSSGAHILTGSPATYQDAQTLHHQYSLPNHTSGHHRGSVAERSSSIITEHSPTSETPPMTGDESAGSTFWPSSNQQYKHLNHSSLRRLSSVIGNNQHVIANTLSVPQQDERTRSGSVISVDQNGKRFRLVIKDDNDGADVEIRHLPRPGAGRNCFHCYLCLGLVAFVTFWLVLMLRIYLPESYWTWSYVW